MSINMIACTDVFGNLGKDGDLLFKIKHDLERFQSLTTGHIVVMGRKTLESLPGQYLKNRVNIVMTRNADYKPKDKRVIVLHSVEDVMFYWSTNERKELWIIGGSDIYYQFYNRLDKIFLTRVLTMTEEADTSIDLDDFGEENFVNVKTELYYSEKYNSFYQFLEYFNWNYLEQQKKEWGY